MPTAAADPAVRGEFERLQAAGQEAARAGRLQEAEEILSRALACAEREGDSHRIDLAVCNLYALTVVFDRVEPLGGGAMNRLREILLRNRDQTHCFLASYILSRAYELRKESRKGLFYSRVALDRSRLLDREDWVGSSRNQIGNLLVLQSCFDEAAREYRGALAAQPQAAEERRAIIEVNLAYCLLMAGDRATAFQLLYRCLRTLRRLGSLRGQMFAHVDLCYGHLDLGRHDDARRHGERGLALAEALGEADSIKNALYLLGQTYHLLEDDATARSAFGRLQDEFYPGSTGIADFLLAVDVRKMINLRA